jgi:dihydrofolate reductase
MIRGMMAASLDGFVAEADGGVSFLEPFHDVDWGYEAFLADVGTVVMGRLTYEQTRVLAPQWPYPGKRAFVLGQGMAGLLDGGAVAWTAGLEALLATLATLTDGDVWVVGGPGLQAEMIGLGALARLEVCIVPRIIGNGIRLFPEGALARWQPELQSARVLPKGMVMLDYRFGAPGFGGVER